MNALKAMWTVSAGVIPGKALPEFERSYSYTSEDDAADKAANSDKNPAYHSIFAKRRAEAIDYYLQVSLPQLNNWATIEFIWL